jgi:hypothetical protein
VEAEAVLAAQPFAVLELVHPVGSVAVVPKFSL